MPRTVAGVILDVAAAVAALPWLPGHARDFRVTNYDPLTADLTPGIWAVAYQGPC